MSTQQLTTPRKVEKRQEKLNVFITLTFSIYAAFNDVIICMFATSGKQLNCVLPYYGTHKFALQNILAS